MGDQLKGQFLRILFIYISILSINFTNSILLPEPTTGIGKNLYTVQVSSGLFSNLLNATEVDKSITFGEEAIGRMQRLETILGWSDNAVKAGTPAHGYAINANADGDAMKQAKQAHIVAKATTHLLYRICRRNPTSRKECALDLSTYSLTSTNLKESCSNFNRSCTPEEVDSPYRSIDGSCNRPSDPALGRSFTNYKRLIAADYLDGIQQPRRSSQTLTALPSARLISTSLAKNNSVEDPSMAMSAMVWSQFISHDLAHTVSNKMIYSEATIDCCTSAGRHLSPRHLHPFCQRIDIPENDPFYSKHASNCMNYVRSLPAVRSDCSFGSYEQLNQASHFMDASQIYGSDQTKANSLRAFNGGFLHTSVPIKGSRDFLPLATNFSESCKDENVFNCFSSGDSRVNFQPQLTSMYIVWHREHNRIARELGKINKHWNDERLYQESRKILIAEMQSVTYKEWLPLIVGKSTMNKISNSKFSEIDPSISNSFANAAVTFFHSLMDKKIKLLMEEHNLPLVLMNHFNDPSILVKLGKLDSMLRGITEQKCQKADFNYVSDVTNELYTTGDMGLDIVSIDIQKGRDHGLRSYTAYRSLCGLPKVKSFGELGDYMNNEVIASLMSVYHHPNDIDLVVGGMLEKPYEDSLLGPTFTCIIADQLKRTRDGDRYFYTNPAQPEPFTVKQLASIEEGTTLARILCDNSGVERMQRNVFKIISDENTRIPCSDLTTLNLNHWLEKESNNI